MSALQRLRDGAKSAARAAVTGAGRLTASTRMLPDFLICGVQRSGTTSLFRTLAQHPDVVPPALNKGIHFFDTADRYARGLDWYRGHFPVRTLADRRIGTGATRNGTTRTGTTKTGTTKTGRTTMGTAQPDGARQRRARTGEASPYYCFHPLAGERIARDLPDARLVVLLRDPVERAYSAWKQETGRGFETEPFERALDLEDERLAGEVERMRADPTYQSFHHQHHAYAGRGEYATQVARLRDLVGERLLVLDSAAVLTPRSGAWEELLAFLGLAPWTPPEVPRANARPSADLDAGLRARLEAHFAPYDEALAALVDWPVPWRR